MMRVTAALALALCASALSACSSAQTPEQIEAKLKDATAEALTVADAGSIIVSKQESTMSRWTWEAKVDGKTYACDADNFFRLPACVPATSPA